MVRLLVSQYTSLDHLIVCHIVDSSRLMARSRVVWQSSGSGQDQDRSLVRAHTLKLSPLAPPSPFHAQQAAQILDVANAIGLNNPPVPIVDAEADAVYWAAAGGDAGNLGLLLALPAPRVAHLLKFKNAHGATPLHAAAAIGSVPCLTLLLDAGADPDEDDKARTRGHELSAPAPPFFHVAERTPQLSSLSLSAPTHSVAKSFSRAM